MNIGNAYLPLEIFDAIGEHFDELDTLMISHVSNDFKGWASRIGRRSYSVRKLALQASAKGSAACLQYVAGLDAEYHMVNDEEDLACIAAFRGNLEVLKYMGEQSILHELHSAAMFALIGGQGECLEYLVDSCGEYTKFCVDEEDIADMDLHPALTRAICCGLKDAVDVLINMGAATDLHIKDAVCGEAASIGDLEILKYLRERGFRCDESAASAAAYSGRANCLRYLIDSGCVKGKDDMLEQDAVYGGNQQCIDMVLALPPNPYYRNRYGEHLFDEADVDDFDNEDEEEYEDADDVDDADVVSFTLAEDFDDVLAQHYGTLQIQDSAELSDVVLLSGLQ